MIIERYFSATPVAGTGIDPNFAMNTAIAMLRDSLDGYALAFPNARSGGRDDADMGAAARRPHLGDKFQVFGPIGSVQTAHDLLEEYFGDYLDISRVRQVPDKAPFYAVYTRVRSKTQTAVLTEVRRFERRHNTKLSPADIEERMVAASANHVLPYFRARSHSTGQEFSVVFKRSLLSDPISGEFDCFGMARAIATVPHLP